VTGSPPLLENLLTNLVKNAVEASPAGETVTVALSGGEGIAVDVYNRGVVPEEIRENFFGKYVTWNKENGIGLGTYIARVIARAHGGDVSFTTDKAAGTHVTVTLPRLP
jgi:signal transduction histidine kinase